MGVKHSINENVEKKKKETFSEYFLFQHHQISKVMDLKF